MKSKAVHILNALVPAILLLVLFSCSPTFDQMVEEVEPVYGSAAVSLSSFSYTGTQKAFITVATMEMKESEYDFHDWNGPEISDGRIWASNFDSDGSYFTVGGVLDGASTEDIAFTGIAIPARADDPNYDPVIKTALIIASDEDGSGDFSDGDIIMPTYTFALKNGSNIDFDGLTFDPLSALIAGTYDSSISLSMDWDFNLNISVPEEDGRCYLFIEDNPNLSAGTFEKEIPVPSFDVKTVTIHTMDGNLTQDYWYLLFQDVNGNGQPDTGEPASESSPITAITQNFHIDAGNYDGSTELSISLTGEYAIQ